MLEAFGLTWATSSSHRTDTLFEFFSALARGEAQSLPGLRPHQREPFHAFVVQVAALALIRASATTMPVDAAGWRALLVGLTPEWPDGEAWTLVNDDWTMPALLQPPIVRAGDRADYRSAVDTPDALDMLVTSRNHDVKAAQMAGSTDEDWFFALLTLQTTEGFLGAGNYGISRMNGGFASRMTFGLRPGGGLAAAWRRDVERLVDDAGGAKQHHGGPALLWLLPWDGTAQLVFDTLDPLYVEICRRVRLHRSASGAIGALTAGSKVARVAAAALKGVTNDPWMPVEADGSKSVSPNAGGFGHRQIVRLLDEKRTTRPLLARPSPSDPAEGMAIVAAALVRGQGKTEGLHRRSIPFSRSIYEKLGDRFLDRVGEVAGDRSADAGDAARRLNGALLMLVQGGPDTPRRDDKSGEAKVRPWVTRFDRTVDRTFFDAAFWAEVAGEAEAPRRAWRMRLHEAAEAVFAEAVQAAPRTAERRIRAQARARNVLEGSFRNFVEDLIDGA